MRDHLWMDRATANYDMYHLDKSAEDLACEGCTKQGNLCDGECPPPPSFAEIMAREYAETLVLMAEKIGLEIAFAGRDYWRKAGDDGVTKILARIREIEKASRQDGAENPRLTTPDCKAMIARILQRS